MENERKKEQQKMALYEQSQRTSLLYTEDVHYYEPYMRCLYKEEPKFEDDDEKKSVDLKISTIEQECKQGIEMPWTQISLPEKGTYAIQPIPKKPSVKVSFYLHRVLSEVFCLI